MSDETCKCLDCDEAAGCVDCPDIEPEEDEDFDFGDPADDLGCGA